MPRAQNDLDRRAKWAKMGMTPEFIVHMQTVNKWEAFKETYLQLWRDGGGIRGPATQRQVAERVWASMAPTVPLPNNIVPFKGTAPATVDKGTAPEVYADVPDVPSEGEYDIEGDVDTWAAFQWALMNCETPPGKITRWRSQLAKMMHRKLRDPVEGMKMFDLFKAKIAGQQTIDRNGKIDDGTAELDLAHEVLQSLQADAEA